MDALVLAILGGAELRLELEAEERLLAVLVARARARDVVAPEDAGDLLKARAEAIRAGLVPTQHARPKRTQDELLQALRHKNRTTAAA